MAKHASTTAIFPPAPQGYECWDDMRIINHLKSLLGAPRPIFI